MKITILGTGNVGSSLGKRWSDKGHEITYGARNPESDRVKDLLNDSQNGTRALTMSKAADGADVVVLATPWSSAEVTLDQVGSLEGKILVDATNPLAEGLSGLSIDPETSAGEMISQWCPGAKVVKAFNVAGTGGMINRISNDQRLTMPICGNNDEAKKLVSSLAEEIDIDIYDAGDITMARYIEPMIMLWITLAYKQGIAPNQAFEMIKQKVEEGEAA